MRPHGTCLYNFALMALEGGHLELENAYIFDTHHSIVCEIVCQIQMPKCTTVNTAPASGRRDAAK